MENEIKVGEYIRTKDGRIIKFNKFGTLRVGCRNPKYYKTIISNRRHYKYDDIVKHSPNLIDIIEERRLCKWKKNRCYHRWFLKARRGWRKGTLF